MLLPSLVVRYRTKNVQSRMGNYRSPVRDCGIQNSAPHVKVPPLVSYGSFPYQHCFIVYSELLFWSVRMAVRRVGAIPKKGPPQAFIPSSWFACSHSCRVRRSLRETFPPSDGEGVRECTNLQRAKTHIFKEDPPIRVSFESA